MAPISESEAETLVRIVLFKTPKLSFRKESIMQQTTSADMLPAAAIDAASGFVNHTRRTRRERIRAEAAQQSAREQDAANYLLQGTHGWQNNNVAEIANSFALMSEENAQEWTQTAQYIQEMVQRHNLELSSLNEEADDLLVGIADLRCSNEELDQQVFTLNQQLAGLMAANQQLAKTFDEACDEQASRELAELSAILTNHSQVTDKAFQFIVTAIQNGLELAVEQQQELDKFELEINKNMQDSHKQIKADLNDLQREEAILDGDLDRLQERVYAQAKSGAQIARLIDEMSSEEYCRQELEKLKSILNNLPNPTIDLLAPLYKKLKDDFSCNVQRIANFNFEEQLVMLQSQILENSVAMIKSN